jgi:hypothetical protein
VRSLSDQLALTARCFMYHAPVVLACNCQSYTAHALVAFNVAIPCASQHNALSTERSSACRKPPRPWWLKAILVARGVVCVASGVSLCSASFGLLASCIRPGTLGTGMLWSFLGIKLATYGTAGFATLVHPEREPPVRAGHCPRVRSAVTPWKLLLWTGAT